MTKIFDNKKRTRYYGLRIGDTVKVKAYNIETAEVAEYGVFDNNRVYIKLPDGEKISCVAEWCKIIKKVEDK